MNELSLFSGAGGGLLGTKLLGWTHIGYVEFNEYCQQVIRARIDDGYLDEAPIFTDVREFLQSGAARQYRGFTDVLTSGFPCQPFSVAGKRQGKDDERNMWPATVQIIREVQPEFCLLENVPGLLSASVDDESGRPVHYFGEILRDLAESGYDARWCVLGADDCGAPHRRKRLWIKATHTDRKGKSCQSKRISKGQRVSTDTDRNTIRKQQVRELRRKGKTEPTDDSKNGVADTEIMRIQGSRATGKQVAQTHDGKEVSLCGSSGKRNDYWSIEPEVGRVANGVASRVDRLKALGNGQVPIVAATAWRILNSLNDE